MILRLLNTDGAPIATSSANGRAGLRDHLKNRKQLCIQFTILNNYIKELFRVNISWCQTMFLAKLSYK